MDYTDQFIEYRELALGSRLKRLSDLLMKETSIIYNRLNIDFDPYHMPIFKLVSEQKNLSISEISVLLNVTQPAVTQYVNSLIRRNIVQSSIDKVDKRKRKIAISKQGEIMLKNLAPIWNHINAELKNMTHNPINKALLDHITFIEVNLKEKSFSNRIMDRIESENYGK